jgi:hypothetical protein
VPFENVWHMFGFNPAPRIANTDVHFAVKHSHSAL